MEHIEVVIDYGDGDTTTYSFDFAEDGGAAPQEAPQGPLPTKRGITRLTAQTAVQGNPDWLAGI